MPPIKQHQEIHTACEVELSKGVAGADEAETDAEKEEDAAAGAGAATAADSLATTYPAIDWWYLPISALRSALTLRRFLLGTPAISFL